MTAGLMAFLRARLDEDDAVARAADAELSTVFTRIATFDPEMAADERHIMRHRPAQVLREVEAKRQIADYHESWTASNGDIFCGRCGREHIDGRLGGHFPCQTLRLLALPYSDHPDYLPEWRP